VRRVRLKTARARYNATPKGQIAKAKGRAKYRIKYRAERKERRRFSRKLKSKERKDAPFTGCDGEGTTEVNPDGSRGLHRYALFRMGERELFRGGARLTTPEILAFILDHPRKSDILVGFAFEYDVTSILVDLPVDRRVHLMETYQQLTPTVRDAEGELKAVPPRPPGFTKRWTWVTFDESYIGEDGRERPYGTFGLNWLSRNHLSVCRPHPRGSIDPRYGQSSDRKTIRTIYDTFGFFQSSFVRALKSWEVGLDAIERIEAMKNARGAFETITDEIRAYNAKECDLLAEVMTRFREVCRDCGIEPRTWNGAGKIASFLHNSHGTLRKKDIASLIKTGVIKAAHAAYYGGRFEITRAGFIAEPVYECDINSAYPAMMRRLPCLLHGEWSHVSGDVLRDLKDTNAIFVCPIRFVHEPGQFLCGLPFRSHRDGRLFWPREGKGVYWSPEIRSAEMLGASCAYGAGWLYERKCACKPFEWVEKLYYERKALGDLKGKPLKLGINALYGKLAQRIGEPQFANPIWAGLITAMTRAALNGAIGRRGKDVVMIATDAIYTVNKPPRVKTGDGLGEWSGKTWPSLFIVQPGLYWGTEGVKSRGLSAATIEKYTGDFEKAWTDFAASGIDPLRKRAIQMQLWMRSINGEEIPDDEILARRAGLFPSVKVQFPAFVGLRLAGHWGKPELAGQWIDQERDVSFSWTGKRDGYKWVCYPSNRKAVILTPLDGGRDWVSAHYEEGGGLSTSEGWEVERMLFETMPYAEPLAPFSEEG
jgi:DNA polymerase type B, organellar and viral